MFETIITYGYQVATTPIQLGEITVTMMMLVWMGVIGTIIGTFIRMSYTSAIYRSIGGGGYRQSRLDKPKPRKKFIDAKYKVV